MTRDGTMPLFTIPSYALRSLADSLPTLIEPSMSAPEASVLAPVPAALAPLGNAELAALEAARAQGYAQGLAETGRLRNQLAALCHARQHQTLDFDRLADAVVDAALIVIETWLESCDDDRRARLAPVVHRWIHEVGADVPAVAQVAACDVAAMRSVLGDIPIEVIADASLMPGDVRLRADHTAIELRWRDRLLELREDLVQLVTEPATQAMASMALSISRPPAQPAADDLTTPSPTRDCT
jgi:Flagellar assembly protein FliH